nr:MAG TPA: hypothetical protein [Caudoviricetes sp.]
MLNFYNGVYLFINASINILFLLSIKFPILS